MKFKYSEEEKEINRVLKYHKEETEELLKLNDDMKTELDIQINESKKILVSLGYNNKLESVQNIEEIKEKTIISIPNWEKLSYEAMKKVGNNCKLEDIFTEKEIKDNKDYINCLIREYNSLYELDAVDYCISAFAGIISAIVDILMVGIPKATTDGLKAGSLSNYIREEFNKKFPKSEMEKLANSKLSKVPYDAQDNRNTLKHVEGLSTYYHRLLSLGHDPLLGFVVGIFDILTGKMTTIDKSGKIISQVMENYSDRKEMNIFKAISKQVIHLKSDMTTSMGLPVPLMGLFNLLNVGNIGEQNQTIAEIVQGMYYEGYDFIHFCSMAIPTMIVEVIVRLFYAIKRIKEGYSLKDSLPFSLNREKNPKLSTMLFIAHSASVAINAGKVYFQSGNPLAINYPEWVAFGKYSYKQLKWLLIEKPNLIEKYVEGKINEEIKEIYVNTENIFQEFSRDYMFVFNK
mgnify:CR=1 FL=1